MNILTQGLFALSSLLCCVTVNAEQIALPPLTVLTFEAPPWVENATSGLSGIAVEQLYQIEKLMGVQLPIELMPTPRAFYQATYHPELNVAMFPCTATSERAENFEFTQQIAGGSATIFTLSPNLYDATKPLSQIIGKKNLVVGTLSGHLLEGELHKMGAEYITVPSIDRLIRMLVLKRIDLIYSYKESYNNEIKNNPAIRALVAAPLSVYQYQLKKLSYGFCINKRNQHVKHYVDQLNQAINTLAQQE